MRLQTLAPARSPLFKFSEAYIAAFPQPTVHFRGLSLSPAMAATHSTEAALAADIAAFEASLKDEDESSHDEAPFSQSYETLTEAETALKAWAHSKLFDLVIHKKTPSAANCTKATYRCAKGRVRRNQKQDDIDPSKRRKTDSKMTNCPFRINIKLSSRRWRIDPIRTKVGGNSSTHNHEMAEGPEAFSSYRKANLERYQKKILTDWKAGTRPSQIIRNLRQDGDVVDFDYHDLQNLLQRCRREELGDRTPMQWLYDVRDDCPFLITCI